MVRGVLVVVALATSSVGQRVDIPVLTVCEALRDLDRLHGQNVIIVGRAASTPEGGWLMEDCDLKIHKTILGQDHAFEPAISTAYSTIDTDLPPPLLPDGFKWDDAALQTKLREVMRTTKLRPVPRKYRAYRDRWYALFGRFESETQCSTDGKNTRCMNGFGHEGIAPAQLVHAQQGRELKPRK